MRCEVIHASMDRIAAHARQCDVGFGLHMQGIRMLLGFQPRLHCSLAYNTDQR